MNKEEYESQIRAEYVYMLDKQQQEIDKYKSIIDEALGIANERINYYAHKQIEAEDWSEIFNVLIKKDNQELKGSDE